jgi:hypothetical protein
MSVKIDRGTLSKETRDHFSLPGNKPVEWMMSEHNPDITVRNLLKLSHGGGALMENYGMTEGSQRLKGGGFGKFKTARLGKNVVPKRFGTFITNYFAAT